MIKVFQISLVWIVDSVSLILKENEQLKSEVARLSQIISDMKQLDVKKTCLCRGRP